MDQYTTENLPFRPISAKFSGLQALRPYKPRPQTAAYKGATMLPRSRTKHENKLERPKGKKSFLSREELTEQLISFKGQTNLLKEENVKLRTRVKFLERDSKKDEGESEKSHLVSSLKGQIKELQKIIEGRDGEIQDLKKVSRVTKVQEIEVEMKMYVDECTRLRRMLQETMNQLFLGVLPQETQQKYIEMSLQLKALKKDYKELLSINEDPGLSKSKTRKRLSLVKIKKSLINTKEENLRVNEDNQRLLQELSSLRNNLRCPNCGFLFEETDCKDVNTIVWDIWQAVEHRRLTLAQVWTLLNPEDFPEISPDYLKIGLEQLGLFLNETETLYFFPNTEKNINFEQFSEILHKLRPTEIVSYSEVTEILMHFSYRLQVRRYEYEQVPMLFFPDAKFYNQMEVYTILQQDPIAFTEIQAEMFTKFLFGSSEALSNDECSARVYQLIDPWQVLTEQEELKYDQKLKQQVQGIGEDLIKKFRELDNEDSGFITLENFYNTFAELGLDIDNTMKQYLSLLFYTDQLEFNLVPYKNFYQAYTSQSNN